MRLQNLLVIFVIIALPVIIILSIFINYQIDTARLKSSYSSKLIDATYDTVAAFQLNTNNNTYSSVTDSLMEDIEASSNIFIKSLASNLGVAGASESQIISYIPALLYTLYDGYYIYTPVKQADGTFVHDIKPYVYYTRTYTNGSKTLTINFSLDNYVAVYYKGRDNNGDWYESRAGYLESETDDPSADGTSYKGCTIKDPDAINYYKEAYAFTKWFNDTVLEDFGRGTDAYNKLYIDREGKNSPLQGASSSFNDEKIDVIEKSINSNLFQAMNIYGKDVGMDFRAPILNGEDWSKIFNNICVISFMQGIPVGTSIFNDYAIITSTDNSMYVDENTLYFIGSDDPNTYHRIGCSELKGETITGHNKAEFKIKQLEENGDIKYTYPNPASACYYCMVRASSASLPTSQAEASWYSNLSERKKRETAYYTALAKQKYKLVKISDYINVNEGNNIEQNVNSTIDETPPTLVVASVDRKYEDNTHKIVITATGNDAEGGTLNYTVSYGTSTAYGQTKTASGTAGKTVTITIDSGLSMATTYYYKVDVTDSDNLHATSVTGSINTWCVGASCDGNKYEDSVTCPTCKGTKSVTCHGSWSYKTGSMTVTGRRTCSECKGRLTYRTMGKTTITSCYRVLAVCNTHRIRDTNQDRFV